MKFFIVSIFCHQILFWKREKTLQSNDYFMISLSIKNNNKQLKGIQHMQCLQLANNIEKRSSLLER
jgi:hypothetical protein